MIGPPGDAAGTTTASFCNEWRAVVVFPVARSPVIRSAGSWANRSATWRSSSLGRYVPVSTSPLLPFWPRVYSGLGPHSTPVLDRPHLPGKQAPSCFNAVVDRGSRAEPSVATIR